jgi:hypothetical protein
MMSASALVANAVIARPNDFASPGIVLMSLEVVFSGNVIAFKNRGESANALTNSVVIRKVCPRSSGSGWKGIYLYLFYYYIYFHGIQEANQ